MQLLIGRTDSDTCHCHSHLQCHLHRYFGSCLQHVLQQEDQTHLMNHTEHAKALMPSFGDCRGNQRVIEVLTHEITNLLKRSEKRPQKLSMEDPSEDSNFRKNVQCSLAMDLQNLSLGFWKKQSSYSKELRQQKEAERKQEKKG
eukprot:XP_008659366.1 syntaxin-42 isoform X3 [Zea mays]